MVNFAIHFSAWTKQLSFPSPFPLSTYFRGWKTTTNVCVCVCVCVCLSVCFLNLLLGFRSSAMDYGVTFVHTYVHVHHCMSSFRKSSLKHTCLQEYKFHVKSSVCTPLNFGWHLLHRARNTARNSEQYTDCCVDDPETKKVGQHFTLNLEYDLCPFMSVLATFLFHI